MDAQVINELILQFYTATDPAQALDAAHALVERGTQLSGEFFDRLGNALRSPNPDYNTEKAMALSLAYSQNRTQEIRAAAEAPAVLGPCS